ncbi:hypothetical protein OK349_02120 [Sphingomonas sp. BT-65]|uniref:hypothetical protein n=1 Tax=Sphingomonas sp. BT-65 TaxID=2989821 RepID=UPI002235CCB2|nr:hypothetical protein [Sphingomonas sp. BT-65]MCW4460486.1 hypothetical protein [Sphingomonas sp. BT-65]
MKMIKLAGAALALTLSTTAMAASGEMACCKDGKCCCCQEKKEQPGDHKDHRGK